MPQLSSASRACTLAIAASFALACDRSAEQPRPGALAGTVPVAIPSNVHIDVRIDDTPAPAIDASKLRATEPERSDRAGLRWTVASLVGPAATRRGLALKIVNVNHHAVELRADANGQRPVLQIDPGGNVEVGLASAPASPDGAAPAGDPGPMIAAVVALELSGGVPATVAAQGGGGDGGALGRGGGADVRRVAAPLEVRVAGGAPRTWTLQTLARVPSSVVRDDGVEHPAWSLRDAAHVLVGPSARVTSAFDDVGRGVVIDAEAWRDPGRTPVIRANRRGTFKLEWVGRDGRVVRHARALRGVCRLDVAPSG